MMVGATEKLMILITVEICEGRKFSIPRRNIGTGDEVMCCLLHVESGETTVRLGVSSSPHRFYNLLRIEAPSLSLVKITSSTIGCRLVRQTVYVMLDVEGEES